MAALSREIIETLIDLVEHKILDAPNDRGGQPWDYRTLQICRYSLLALAAEANGAEGCSSLERQTVRRPDYLRLITGGKA